MIKALTIQQPWAGAIVRGPKRVENRTWPTRHTGMLAIHAGKGIDWRAPAEAWTAADVEPYPFGGPRPPARADWVATFEARGTYGAVIGLATLAECHPSAHCARPVSGFCSPWAMPGQYHWVLEDVTALAEPVPCDGKQGLWDLPALAEMLVRARGGLVLS